MWILKRLRYRQTIQLTDRRTQPVKEVRLRSSNELQTSICQIQTGRGIEPDIDVEKKGKERTKEDK